MSFGRIVLPASSSTFPSFLSCPFFSLPLPSFFFFFLSLHSTLYEKLISPLTLCVPPYSHSLLLFSSPSSFPPSPAHITCLIRYSSIGYSYNTTDSSFFCFFIYRVSKWAWSDSWQQEPATTWCSASIPERMSLAPRTLLLPTYSDEVFIMPMLLRIQVRTVIHEAQTDLWIRSAKSYLYRFPWSHAVNNSPRWGNWQASVH